MQIKMATITRRLTPFGDWCRKNLPFSYYHCFGLLVALLLMIIGLLLPSDPQPQHSPSSNFADHRKVAADTQGHWHKYQIHQGETLAQMFRNHKLPVEVVFAMAQVEGADKPLSNISVGQWVRLRINQAGEVTGLTLNTASGDALFVRQSDGSFIRAQ